MDPPAHKTPQEKLEEIADLLAELKATYIFNPYEYHQFMEIEKIITDNGSNQQIMTRAMNNYRKKEIKDSITKLQQELDQLQ
jgi:hypothetical protein